MRDYWTKLMCLTLPGRLISSRGGGGGGGGVLLRILDRGVPRRFVNPNPI